MSITLTIGEASFDLSDLPGLEAQLSGRTPSSIAYDSLTWTRVSPDLMPEWDHSTPIVLSRDSSPVFSGEIVTIEWVPAGDGWEVTYTASIRRDEVEWAFIATGQMARVVSCGHRPDEKHRPADGPIVSLGVLGGDTPVAADCGPDGGIR